ncbi:FMN-binding protein [Marinilabilia salmonicolor]|uniref:FMN-binding protein n=1 Tax=Marinilabilia salmonicolor TaxID=989 RepID=UPI001F31696C|nr:FMN-binding protein [Marinilabilia salmonicolor]
MFSQGEPAGNSEYFDYFILFDAEKSVQVVKVFNYQATHGYEITSRGWLKQFAGHDGSESLQVNKNIDAISGATISVQAITEDVQRQTSLLQRMKI